MVLPPGREPIPVPDIDPEINPRLARSASELAAWIDYLLHPESHDGPRLYRSRPEYEEEEIETSRPWDTYENNPAYDTVSVLENYAADSDVFFRPVQAVCGVRGEVIDASYRKFTKGFLTWELQGSGAPAGEEEEGTPSQPSSAPLVVDKDYPEIHPARFDWFTMRSGWDAPENDAAAMYEPDFIAYQVYTEVCVYRVAEALARYWAIYHQAGQDVQELMEGLTEKMASHEPQASEGGISFDLTSIALTVVASVACTVITGGAGATVGVALAAAAVDALSEAAKTAEKKNYRIDSHRHLRDTAKQYLDEVLRIEENVAAAIKKNTADLRKELERLRDEREYEVVPDSGTVSGAAPRIRDYPVYY